MSTEELLDGGFTHLYNWDYEASGSLFTWRRDGYCIEAYFVQDTNDIEVTVKSPNDMTLDEFTIDVSPATTSRIRPPQNGDEITREVQERVAARTQQW